MKSAYFVLLLSLFTTVACHKHAETENALAPTLSITSPLVDDQFANDLVIKMTGLAGDADGLHTMTIKITDDKTKAVLFTQSPDVLNLKSYTYSATWTAKVADWTDATVTVIATNHAGLESTKAVKIKIWF